MDSFIEPHMRESLKDHVLVPVLETNQVQAFYLKRPGEGRMMSTLITFTPEGIVLQGDLTPGSYGNVSTFGYGREWFSGQLSEGYLCEKFLSRCFVPEYAELGLRREILRQRRELLLSKEEARELWRFVHVSTDFTGQQDTYDFWTTDLHNLDTEDCPGYGYEPAEAGWLCAIQQKFAELYWATKGITPEVVHG